MSRRNGKERIEVDSDVQIWTCDECGKEVSIPRDDGLPGLNPIGWIAAGVNAGIPAAIEPSRWDFCSTGCTGTFFVKRHQAAPLIPTTPT